MQAQYLSLRGARVCRLSTCGSEVLEHRLSSCRTWAQLLYGIWNLPRPGIEPMSPVLAGRFLAMVPPREVLKYTNFKVILKHS